MNFLGLFFFCYWIADNIKLDEELLIFLVVFYIEDDFKSVYEGFNYRLILEYYEGL